MNAKTFIRYQMASLKYVYNSQLMGFYEYCRSYYPDLLYFDFIDYFSETMVDEDGCEIERIENEEN